MSCLKRRWKRPNIWCHRHWSRWNRRPTVSCYAVRSEEHTSELQSPCNIVCRLLLEKKNGMPKSNPPLGELQVQEAQNLVRVARFGLAVAVGIHRERILTIGAKHKWILLNRGQTRES